MPADLKEVEIISYKTKFNTVEFRNSSLGFKVNPRSNKYSGIDVKNNTANILTSVKMVSMDIKNEFNDALVLYDR